MMSVDRMGWVVRGLAVALVLTIAALPASATRGDEAAVTITLPPDLPQEERDAFLVALERLAVPVVVATGPAEDDGEPPHLARLIARFDAAIAAAPEVPGLAARWFTGLEHTSLVGCLLALVMIVVALAAGAGIEMLLRRALAPWRARCLRVADERFTNRLLAALGWFAIDLAGLAVFFASAMLAGWLLAPGTETTRATLAILILAIVKIRFFIGLACLIFSPHHPELRLLPVHDADVRPVYRWVLILVLLAGTGTAVRNVLVHAGASADAAAFLGLVLATVVLAARITAFIAVRRPIRALIHAAGANQNGEVPGAVRRFGDIWHLVFSGLAVIDFAGRVYALLASGEVAAMSGSIGAMIYIVLLPFVLGAYRGVIDDRLATTADDPRGAGVARAIRAFGQGLIILVTLLLISINWGVDPFAGEEAGIGARIARALLGAGAAVLIGWAIWAGLKAIIDRYAPAPEGDEVSEDGMGKQGSRLETLLPVIRSFVLATVLVLTVMTALSALGVDIGPLLAGAGVVGLAIGFGAQALVRDIITGLFYLVEDAFRKGEYIESAAGKGVVEKISIRSVQLRHHRGPLSTIPFGSMGNILNHSRDWVKIKFLLRVPFDTDIEKVRKLIKRVGQEMQNDEVFGPQFLQPVKSQGVMDVDDSAFVIGVKFLCRPGEQFVLKREAYARIKKAFAENGIEFASRRVTVETEDDGERAKGSVRAGAAGDAAVQAATPAAAE